MNYNFFLKKRKEESKAVTSKAVIYSLIFLSLFLFSFNLVSSLPNDANSRIDFTYPDVINYSTIPTVNNSLYWQGHTGTDGSWLTGINHNSLAGLQGGGGEGSEYYHIDLVTHDSIMGFLGTSNWGDNILTIGGGINLLFDNGNITADWIKGGIGNFTSGLIASGFLPYGLTSYGYTNARLEVIANTPRLILENGGRVYIIDEGGDGFRFFQSGKNVTMRINNKTVQIGDTTEDKELLIYGDVDATGNTSIGELITQGTGTIDLATYNNFFDNIAIDGTEPELHLRDGTTDWEIVHKGGVLEFQKEDAAQFKIGSGQITIQNGAEVGTITLDATGDMHLRAAGSGGQALTIKEDLKVGIGTTTPDRILHVYKGDSGFVGIGGASDTAMLFENDANIAFDFLTPNDFRNTIYFSDEDQQGKAMFRYSHGTDLFSFAQDSNYFSFSVPAARVLYASPNTFLRGGSWGNPTNLNTFAAGDRFLIYKNAKCKTGLGMLGDNGMYIQAHGGGALLELWSGGANAVPTQKFTFMVDGRMGIGTASPTQKLNVVGSANITGNITASYYFGDGSLLSNLPTGEFKWLNTSTNLYINSSFPQNINISGNLTVDTLFAKAINISNSSFSFTHNENNSIDYVIQNQNSGSNATSLITTLNDVGGLFGIGIGSSNYLLGSILKANVTALFSKSRGEMLFANFYNEAFVWLVNPSDDNDPNNLKEVMRLDENGLNVSRNFTANNYYAEVWTQDVVIDLEEDVYQNISNLNNSRLNGFTHDGNHTLTALIGGLYQVNSQFAFSGTPNNEYHLRFAVNGVGADNCHTERLIGSGGDVGSASITCLCPMEANDYVNIQVENIDSAGNPTIHDINLNLVRIGD